MEKGGITFEIAHGGGTDGALWNIDFTHALERRCPMHRLPSDEDVGRQIVSIFMRHRVPVSGMLPRNYFFDVRDGDFQRGINKAVANNWITIDQRNRYRYQLTAAGHAVGRVIDTPSEDPGAAAGT